MESSEQPEQSPPSPSSKRQTRPVAYAYQYLRSRGPKRQHPKRLKQFFNLLIIQGKLQGKIDDNIEQQARTFLTKVTEEQEHKNNKHWIEEVIMDFLEFHKERVENREITAGTLGNIFQAVECFCQNHDLPFINWKRIRGSLPKAVKKSDDRCPTLEEIRKLVEFTDRRIKPIVYIMASSGIRSGAWDYLKYKHVIPITNAEYLRWEKQQLEIHKKDHSHIVITNDDENKIIAAQIIVYAGEPEEHFSFITPEAYNSLKEWMDFRASCGEKVTEESWLMRDKWRTIDVKSSGKVGGRNGLATCPKKLGEGGVLKILQRGWKTQGIRGVLPEGQKRHEFKESHGFKKYFTTYAEGAGVRESFVQFFTDHTEGSQGSYRKPPVMLALSEYLKAVENLTINDNSNNNSSSLKKQVAELTEKSKEETSIIKGKLAEKELEAEETKKKLTELEIQQQERFNQMQEMQEEFSNLRDITLNLYSKLGVEAPKNDNEIIKLPAPIANLETELHRLRSKKKKGEKGGLMIY